jgi:hypothetical protein
MTRKQGKSGTIDVKGIVAEGRPSSLRASAACRRNRRADCAAYGDAALPRESPSSRFWLCRSVAYPFCLFDCDIPVQGAVANQIRNRGTVGGSLAHAVPAAELPGVARHSALSTGTALRDSGSGLDTPPDRNFRSADR